MKKYIFLVIILVVLILAGLGIKVQMENATITIQARTPDIVFNEMAITGVDDNKLLLPIKSIKVLSSSTPVEVSFTKIDNGTKDTNLFKYKDLSKYSVINYSFTSSHLDRTYGYPLTMDYNATLEITLYKSEISKESLKKLKNYTYFMQHAKDTLYFLVDPYNGGIKSFVTPNTSNITDISELNKVRTQAIGEQYNNMLVELVQKPEFLKAANEIKSTFKSDSVYDKSYSIYTWITSHIKNDNVDPNKVYSEANKNDTMAAYKALITGKSSCLGYAYLFDALARYWDVPTYVFEGQGGGIGGNLGDHYWNVVVDGKKALLIDSTFGAGEPKPYFVYAPNEAFANCHQVWNNEQNNFFPMLEVNIQ